MMVSSLFAMENSYCFSSLRFALILAIFFATTLCSPKVITATEGLEASFIPLTPPPTPQDLNEPSFFSNAALLPPILSHLGFHELATVAPSLLDAETTASSAWTGPYTIFAPSDAALSTCYSCSVPNLLREHIVPGLFTIEYIRRLASGTKIDTLSPGRCITVTSDSVNPNTSTAAAAKVFVGGIEITQPDLFNNGVIVVHGIQCLISSFSCDVERMSLLSFPFHPDHRSGQHIRTPSAGAGTAVLPAIMRLRDAMLGLPDFDLLDLAMETASYDYLVRAEYWPPGLCRHSHRPCKIPIPGNFTFHGLWPSKYVGYGPEWCSYNFDRNKITNLEPKLEEAWPNLFGIDFRYWKHEWNRHGSCSNMRELDYFQLVLDLRDEFNLTSILEAKNIKPRPNEYLTQEIVDAILASDIGVNPRVECVSSDLVGIRLCLDYTASHYEPCQGNPHGNCPSKVFFRALHEFVQILLNLYVELLYCANNSVVTRC